MRRSKLLTFLIAFLLVSTGAGAQCFTSSTPANNCTDNDAIDEFTLNSVTTSGNYGCTGSSGYVFYSTQTRTLNIGSTYSFTATTAASSSPYFWPEGFAIWIDLNADGEYSSSEMLYSSSSAKTYHSGSFTIPSTATAATVKMRTRCAYNAVITSGQACATGSGFGSGYGETEDYSVILMPPCNVTYTAQPAASTICNGGNTYFRAKASATATSYQWQVNTGSGYTNITNGGVYSRATTDSLVITGATAAMNGYLYRLNAASSICTTGTTPVALTVNTAPAVVIEPVNRSVCVGGTTTFNVVASGAGLTYQWQVNTGTGFTNITNTGVYSAATTASLVVTGMTAAMSGYQYQVVITGTCAPTTTTSATVTLSAAGPIAVATNPANTPVCLNANTSFTASMSGGIVGYQWQENTGSGFTNITNGGVYGGATTATLTITGATNVMNGNKYRLVGTGCSNTATTAEATLTVNTAAAITTQPTATTSCPNIPVNFSVAGTGSSLTYQWQVSTNSGSTWTALTNNATYNNVTTNTLTVTVPALSMSGYLYRAVVTSTLCGSAVNSASAALTVSTAITMNAQPTSKIICEGSGTTFNVAASSSGLTYQWQQSADSITWNTVGNAGVYSGATTATLTITGSTYAMNGYRYRCVIGSSCSAPVNSAMVRLTVNLLPNVTAQPSAVTVCDGSSVASTATFSIAATGTNISYQWQENAGSGFVNVTNGIRYTGVTTTSLTVNNPPPSFNTYTYRCVVSGTCTPAANSNAATLTVNTRPVVAAHPANTTICPGDTAVFTINALATGISYQWQSQVGGSYVNLVNGTGVSGATTATLRVSNPTAAQNFTNFYRCVISGTCTPPAISRIASYFVATPPAITKQPVDKAACLSGATTFFIGASATTPSASFLFYQWQVSVDGGTVWTSLTNTAPYTNVTTNAMTITAATQVMAGYRYRCIVSTSCLPSVTSSSARLSIIYKPEITAQSAPVTTCPGTVASFSIAATGTSILYQWQVNTGTGFVNIPLNTLPYEGVKGPKLSISPAAVSMNNYQYRCVVSGDCTPTATSIAALLKVHNPVTIVSQTIKDSVCETNNRRIGLRASGAALLYQWQVQTSPGFYKDLNNIPPYSGVNTDSLRLTNIPASLNGNVYRCYITEKILCNLGFYSADIPLHVNDAPAAMPAKITAPFFGVVTFSVPNAGEAFQWQENVGNTGFADITDTMNYTGVKTHSLTIKDIGFDMTGNQYRCIVKGICDAPLASKPSLLVVDAALGVSNVKASDAVMHVYPNPLSGTQLNISFDKAMTGATEVKVLDKLGKLVYKGPITLSLSNTASVELNGIAAGTYMLQVTNMNDHFTRTIQFTKQ